MRLGLIEGPGHHAPLMCAQLQELGHDIVLVRAHPHFSVSSGSRRGDALLHDGVRQIVASAQHRLQLPVSWDFDVYTRLYGRLAARYLEGCDAVIGFSFVARESMRRARRAILELPATHLAAHEQIVDEEHARAGQRRKSRLSRSTLARAEAEYAEADLVEVLSSYARKTLLERGVPADKIVVSPPGIAVPAAVAPRAEGRFRVLCVGRIELQKGIRYLTRACPRDAELVLVGALSDEARPFLGTAQVRPPLSSAELAAEYRRADALAFPTLSDGFGLVMLEAMAAGIAVVASDRSGAPDVIQDGVDGFVVPAGDSEALADRLHRLQKDPGLRLEMGRAARARVAAEFSPERYRERLAQLLQRANRGESAAAPRETAAPPSPR
jgi:glycosyltransferase involved in cell wall biosynthesis